MPAAAQTSRPARAASDTAGASAKAAAVAPAIASPAIDTPSGVAPARASACAALCAHAAFLVASVLRGAAAVCMVLLVGEAPGPDERADVGPDFRKSNVQVVVVHRDVFAGVVALPERVALELERSVRARLFAVLLHELRRKRPDDERDFDVRRGERRIGR